MISLKIWVIFFFSVMKTKMYIKTCFVDILLVLILSAYLTSITAHMVMQKNQCFDDTTVAINSMHHTFMSHCID